MGELVTLHTQELIGAQAGHYIDRVHRALRAARLNSSFPDRRRLQASLELLGYALEMGIYEELYLDSRTGLPNLATLTRVLTDQEVAGGSLARMGERDELAARLDEAEVFGRLVDKHDYYQQVKGRELAPVDAQRVLLRRHDPAKGEAAFRIELTKLDGSGLYLRLTIELTQVAKLWRRRVIDLEEDGETAAASQAFRSTVYRCAHLDAETIFLHLHKIEGVSVERVQRGIVGPFLYYIPGAEHGLPAFTAEPDGALGDAWRDWLQQDPPERAGPEPVELLTSFATDAAALDVREERSNDPLSPLLADRLTAGERPRYDAMRSRYPFRVFKDRKFVATPGLKPVARELCERAGTRNLIYDLR